MTIYFAAGHAGFELKNVLVQYVNEDLGHDTVDCGATALDPEDDYPDIVMKAVEEMLAAGGDAKAVILGGSGQGEAMVANRMKGVRAAVYYGEAGSEQTDADGNTLDILESTRLHNDANVLSLGARFISEDEAKEAVKKWLGTPFSGEERHTRRIHKLDA